MKYFPFHLTSNIKGLFNELCAINKIHFDETELMGTVEMIAFAALIKVNRVPVVSDIN